MRHATLIITMLAFLAPQALADIGQRWASEKSTVVDPVTGTTLTRLTSYSGLDTKLYQTHDQWSADGEYIIFLSQRGGNNYQLFALHESSGEIVQLTDDPKFAGGTVTQALSRQSNILYYLRGDYLQDDDNQDSPEIVELNYGALLQDSVAGAMQPVSAYERVVYTAPAGTVETGGISLDLNEQSLYFNTYQTADANTWNNPTLQKVDVTTGIATTIVQPGFRVGHIQASPFKSGEIMYAHEQENGEMEPMQRIWMVNADGTNNRGIYDEKIHSSGLASEAVTHEVWVSENEIVYNVLGYQQWRKDFSQTGIFIHNIDTDEREFMGEIDGIKPPGAPATYTFTHVAVSPDGQTVIGDVLDIYDLYFIDRASGNMKLLTAGHGPKHPHQSFSPDGSRLLINTSWYGSSELMLVAIPEPATSLLALVSAVFLLSTRPRTCIIPI